MIGVVVVAAVIGLSFVVDPGNDGTAVPVAEKPGMVVVNTREVPFRQLPVLGQAAFVRSTDPCGFIAPDPLRSLGSFTGVVHSKISNCEFDFGVDEKTAMSGEVSFDTRPPDTNSSTSKYTTETLSGQQVLLEDGTNDCTASMKIDPPLNPAYTPRGDTPGITRPPSPVWLLIKQFSSRAQAPGCDAVRTLAAAAAQHVSAQSYPARSPGPSTPPITTKDPCKVVGSLPGNMTLTNWLPTIETGYNGCSLTLGEQQDVRILYSLESENSIAQGSTNPNVVDLDGRKVFEQNESRGCMSTTTAGNPVSLSLGSDSATYYPTVTVSGTGTCEALRGLVTATATAASS